MGHAIGTATGITSMDGSPCGKTLQSESRPAQSNAHAHGALVGSSTRAGPAVGPIVSIGPLHLKILTEITQPGGKVKVVLAPQPGILPGATRYYARLRAIAR